MTPIGAPSHWNGALYLLNFIKNISADNRFDLGGCSHKYIN